MSTQAPLEDPEQLVFLADLDEDGWAEVIAATERIAFRPGDVVMKADAQERELCLLVEGTLMGLIHDPSTGQDREVRVVEAPSVVGEVAFLDGHGRSLTLRAETEGELLRLTWDRYQELTSRRPDLTQQIALDLGRIVAGRLRGATELIRRSLGDATPSDGRR